MNTHLQVAFVVGALLLISVPPDADASPGDLDLNFGVRGKVTTGFADQDYARGVALQSDGKIVVAGERRNSSNNTEFAIARYTTAGALDTTFNTTGRITTAIGTASAAQSVAVQSDGKIVVAGHTWNGSNYDFALVRYTSGGALDTTFNSTGRVTTAMGSSHDQATSLAIQSDGKIVVAGYAWNGSNYDFAVARYTAAGALDTTFGTSGKTTFFIGTGNDHGQSVLVQGDGKIVVAGYATDASGTGVAMARLTSTGSLDTSFATGGRRFVSAGGSDSYGYAGALQLDGKLVVAGSVWNGADWDMLAFRFNADGTSDTSFGTGGYVQTDLGAGSDVAYSAALQGDGRIVLGGQATVNYSGVPSLDTALVCLTSAGASDTSFNTTGRRTWNHNFTATSTDYGSALAIQSDGQIIVAGTTHATTSDGNPDFSLARTSSTGTAPSMRTTTEFCTTFFTANASVTQLDGRTIVVGNLYDSTAGSWPNDFAIARYTPSGTLDTTFVSGQGWRAFSVSGQSDVARAVAIQSDGKIVLAGDTYNGTTYNFTVIRVSADGLTLDTSLDGDGVKYVTITGANSAQCEAVAVQSDGRLVLAGSDGSDFLVMRLTTAGAFDTSFNSTGYAFTDVGSSSWDAAHDLVVQPDGKLLAVGESSASGTYDFALVRYNTNGSLDTSFGTGGKVTTPISASNTDIANAVALQSNGRIIVAGQTRTGGTGGFGGSSYYDIALARYNSNGTLDTSFNGTGKVVTSITTFSSGVDIANSVAVRDDGLIWVGGNSSNGSNSDFALLRYTSSGSLDARFHSDGILTIPMGTAGDVNCGIGFYGGGVLLTGSANVGNHSNFALTKVLTDDPGSPDLAFSSDGLQTTPIGAASDVARALVIQPDGKIIAAGHSSNGSNDDFALVRYLADGTVDTSFGGTGKITTSYGSGLDQLYGVGLQSDGKIVGAGTISNGTNLDFAIVRYTSSGGLDSAFSNNIGFAGNDEVTGMVVQPDDKIVVVGYTYSGSGSTTDVAVARFTPAGALDTTFSGDGKATFDVIGSGDYAFAAALQPDGKIVVVGETDNGNYDLLLIRLNANGTLDTSFDGDGMARRSIGTGHDYGRAVTVQRDGRIVVAGQSVVAGGLDLMVARFTENGAFDPTFGSGGKVTTPLGSLDDHGSSVTVQTDGRILVGGFAVVTGGSNVFALARYNVDGTLDTTFDGDGKVTTDFGGGGTGAVAYAMGLQQNGDVVLAGRAQVGGQSDFALARYLAMPKPGVWGLAASQGAGGSNLGVSGQVHPAGLSTTVSIEYGTTAGLGSTQSVGTFTGTTPQSFNATLYPGGLTWGTTYYYRLVATNANGTTTTATQSLVYAPGARDFTFGGGDGVQITPFASGPTSLNAIGGPVARQADGKILVGGYAHNGTNNDFALARYLPDGTLDATFGTGGVVTTAMGTGDDFGSDIVVQADGKILLAGTSASPFDMAVARYLPDGTLDSTFGTAGKARISISSHDDYCNSIALQPDGKLVLVGTMNSQTASGYDTTVVRLNANGTLDTSFDGDGIRTIVLSTLYTDEAYEAVIQTDGKILLAGRKYVSTTAGNSVVMRLNANGSTDTAYGTSGITELDNGGDDLFFGLALQSDGRAVMVGYANAGADSTVVRLTTAGALDTSFNGTGRLVTSLSTGDDALPGVAIQPDGRIVCSGRASNGTNLDMIVIRLSPDGTFDTTFDGDGRATFAPGPGIDSLSEVLVAPDGTIVAAGRSDSSTGVSQFAVVRLLAGPMPLLVNGGFEANETLGGGLPTVYGDWKHDMAAIVTAENGITPYEGSRMVKFLYSGPNAIPLSLSESEVLQYVDLSAYANSIALGLVSVSASARVNRVAGNASTDSRFALYIRSLSGSLTGTNTFTNDAEGSVLSDANAATWELISTSMSIPAGSTYLFCNLYAQENILNNTSGIEFDGHYADDVQLTVNVAPFAPTFTSASSVGATVAAPVLTGMSIGSITLGYAPAPGDSLMLIKNTALGFITGQFSNLAQGQTVTLSHGGLNYDFVANYFGGTGNDLVLVWKDTKVWAWGTNVYGQIGDGSTNPTTPQGKLLPIAVATNGMLAGKTVVTVAAGNNHSLALCSDGSLAAWGLNHRGQLGNNSITDSSVPVAVSTAGVLAGKVVVAVAAGFNFSLALCSDGTLAAWGANDDGQLGNNSTTQSLVPVAVSTAGVLAGKTVVTVAAGFNFSLVLCSDGTLATWGGNTYGQLGNNSTTNSSVPVAVSTVGVLAGKTAIAVAAGGYHNLALCADGSSVAWGFNSDGQLGSNGLNSFFAPLAVDSTGVLSAKTPVAVASGNFHSLALCSDGTLTAWGANSQGQLGNNSTSRSSVPVAVSTAPLTTGQRFIRLGTGSMANHTLALVASPPAPVATTLAATSITGSSATVNGTVNAVGGSATVTFEYGLTTSYGSTVTATPSPVTGTTVTSVTAALTGLAPGTTYRYRVNATTAGGTTNGADHTFTTLSDVTAIFNTPTDVPAATPNFTASGGTLSLALGFAPNPGTNLTVIQNTGLGFITGQFTNLSQGQTMTLSYDGVNYDFVANYYGGTGNDLVLVWKNSRPLAWGNNGSGQLGNNSTTQSNAPVAVLSSGVLSGKTVVAMAAGSDHSVALCADGTVAAWGNNSNGQLGNNSTTNSNVPVAVNTSGVLAGKTVVAVAAGWYHSMALCSDGTVAAWGGNFFGQFGNNSVTDSLVPVAAGTGGALSGKTVVAIAAGEGHSLALCADGTVAAWGEGSNGQLGNNSTGGSLVPVAVNTGGVLSGKTVVAIAAGFAHNVALCSDGTVAAWGYNPNGQLGNNSTTDSAVPVAVNTSGVLSGKTAVGVSAGQIHSVALCSDGTVAAWGHGFYGQLGNNSATSSPVPVAVSTSGVLADKVVVNVVAGSFHCVAFCADGTVAVWGRNHFGQLGNDSTTLSRLPVTVNTSALAVGERFAKALSGSGSGHTLGLAAAAPPAAEIALSGNRMDIANGDSTPGTADHTDFGSTTVAGGTVARTFTITNSGTAALNLTGTPKVVVSGPNAGDFAVTLDPTAPVAESGGTTTFQVTFDPSASGPRTATISIANDDADENPFTFAIAGTGLSAQESWRQQYFGTTSNTGNAADTFDFDKDGLPNLLEWAAGLIPTTSSFLSTPMARNGSTLEFIYTRSIAAVNAGAGFTVEWSDDLPALSWSSAGVTQTEVTNNGTLQQMKATLPAGSLGRRFVRLRVEAPPP